MKASYNPYNPGAGVPPPALTGRDDLLKKTEIAIERLRAGLSSRSAIMLGRRGVGKTALLNRFEQMAEAAGCQTLMLEVESERAFLEHLLPLTHRLLLRLARLKTSNDGLQKPFGLVRSVARAHNVPLADSDFGAADVITTGELALDLTDLFVAVAEAAKRRETCIVLLVDEIQHIQPGELSALIMAMHKISQRQLPLLLLGAGLPQLAKLAGDAKTYAERLFDYPPIGPLDDASAKLALSAPAEREGVKFERDALDYVIEQTGRYPFFLQVWGSHCWDVAQKSPITLADAKRASETAIAALDEGIFKVRLARLTERQKAYARAMADFGSEPVNSSDVANAMKLSLSQAAPIRDELIKKGMAYSPERGLIGFTVPKFDEYMRRAMPATKRKAAKT